MHKIIPAGNGGVNIYKTSNAGKGEEITLKNLKKDVFQNLETMSFVNVMTKFGWHSSAQTMKSLVIFNLNFCIRVDIINVIAILK